MVPVEQAIDYLQAHSLYLTTAEFCTAGRIISLLAEVPHCGNVVESGYVVYSPDAKNRLLGGRPNTIANFNLTSKEVAREMALGALRDSPANTAIATTGLCGEEDVDGIPAGNVCFAWGFLLQGRSGCLLVSADFLATGRQCSCKQLPMVSDRCRTSTGEC